MQYCIVAHTDTMARHVWVAFHTVPAKGFNWILVLIHRGDYSVCIGDVSVGKYTMAKNNTYHLSRLQNIRYWLTPNTIRIFIEENATTIALRLFVSAVQYII